MIIIYFTKMVDLRLHAINAQSDKNRDNTITVIGHSTHNTNNRIPMD
jgi:hypothetical protein